MKHVQTVAFMLLFAVSAGIHVAGAASPVDNLGTKIEITGVNPKPFTWSVGCYWLFNPNEINDLLSNISLSYFYDLLWNPKANTVVYSDIWYGIYSAPITGGKPGIVFDGVSLYKGKELTLILLQAGIRLGGFSPDGRFLYFSYSMYDESRGATMKVEEGDGWIAGGATFTQACNVVMRLDMESNAVTEIADSSSVLTLSRSGKYLCCKQNVQKKAYIRDLENGNTWTLPINIKNNNFHVCITPDDRSVIYSAASGTHPYQLFRMPIEGGEPEQLSTYDGGEIGESREPFDCSPDGEWVLYEDVDNSKSISGTVTSPDGTGWGKYSKPPCRLCAFNLITRETVQLLPYAPSYAYGRAKFSPDGTSFCYSLMDADIWREDNSWSMYVHDFDPGGANQTAVAVTALASFALTGNYPNPFNPSTTIEFSLVASGKVDLAVYDITGRRVRTLASGPMNPGRHEVVWDGRDDRGVSAASGVYFARLQSGGTVLARRMLLMK